MACLLELLEREKELKYKIVSVNNDIENHQYTLDLLKRNRDNLESKLNQTQQFIKNYVKELEDL